MEKCNNDIYHRLVYSKRDLYTNIDRINHFTPPFYVLQHKMNNTLTIKPLKEGENSFFAFL